MGLPNHEQLSPANPDPITPAARGRRTPIATLYRRAEVEPNKLFGSFPLTDNIDDGFRDFTFGELAKAVDVCAWHLKSTYGTSDNFEAILYMGVNDFRYAILFYTAIKCGFQCLFINPKYPIEGVMAVIEKIKCWKAFYSIEELPIIQNIQSRRPGFEARELAPTTHWLDAQPKPFPFYKTWEESKHDKVLSVHSSGTTGLPKPITFQNGFFATFDLKWPVPKGEKTLHPFESVEGCHLAFSIFPQAHAGGFFMNNLRPVFGTAASCMLPANADYTRSSALTLQVLQKRPVDTVSATPLLLENLSQLPGGIDALRNLKSVMYAGGPLRQEVADKIAGLGITGINCFGITEVGIVPGLLIKDPEDMDYFHFNPNYKAVFEPQEDDAGSSELIIRKGEGQEEEELHKKRGIYWSFGVDEYRTKDLFLPHPTKPGFWKYYGRKDDILVLASAGKINPIPVEDTICGHPGISGALVTGEHRFPPCILIEPADRIADHRLFLQEIWPQIEKANRKLRKEMRVPKDKVAILEVHGLERGIKGQIVRKTNSKKYENLIEKLYTA